MHRISRFEADVCPYNSKRVVAVKEAILRVIWLSPAAGDSMTHSSRSSGSSRLLLKALGVQENHVGKLHQWITLNIRGTVLCAGYFRRVPLNLYSDPVKCT